MDVVDNWTGRKASALQKALRETNEGFARRIGIAVRTVAKWNADPKIQLTPEMQHALDTLLFGSPDAVKARFGLLVESRGTEAAQRDKQIGKEFSDLSTWSFETNTDSETIQELEIVAHSLSATHTQVPALQLLPQVAQARRKVESILAAGKQRLSQSRDLIRINGQLLAHACVLLGDLGQDELAENVGRVALIHAQEAEAEEAISWYARAKTARWQDKFAEAADLARLGFERSPEGAMRLQLAWYEANSAALMGDMARARKAAIRAENAAGSVNGDERASVWSFPTERQALFAMSFSNRIGDYDGALRAVEEADRIFESGEIDFPALWAQLRVGASMALIMKGELEGSAEQISQISSLPTGLRMATVTRYLEDVEPLLNKAAFQGSRIADGIKQQIREFRADSVRE